MQAGYANGRMRDTMNLMEQRRVVDGYTYWMMRVHYDTSTIRNPKRIPCRRITNQPTSTADLAEWMQLNPTPVLAGSDREHYGRQLFDLQIPLWTPRQVYSSIIEILQTIIGEVEQHLLALKLLSETFHTPFEPDMPHGEKTTTDMPYLLRIPQTWTLQQTDGSHRLTLHITPTVNTQARIQFETSPDKWDRQTMGDLLMMLSATRYMMQARERSTRNITSVNIKTSQDRPLRRTLTLLDFTPDVNDNLNPFHQPTPLTVSTIQLEP